MAKLTLTQVASAFESIQAINSNYTLIEAAIENTVSRDGTAPNSMNANLDMNGFTILNTTAIYPAESITNTPEGNIAATDVQAALNELDVEKPQIFDGQTSAPTINDDISNGFKKGDTWIDETNDDVYVSVDETNGAALWIQAGTSNPGGVTSVGATAPITSSGGANPTIGLSGLTASAAAIVDVGGFYTATDVEGALQEVVTDLAATTTGDGASRVGIEDSLGNFTATDMEGVAAELQSNIDTNATDIQTIQTKTLELNTKVVTIPAWDMDATSSLSVAHGIDITKFIALSVTIISDGGLKYTIDHNPTGILGGGAWAMGTTNVVLTRVATAFFDDPSFDDIGIDRGLITLTYVD